jgi:hypothetical protein
MMKRYNSSGHVTRLGRATRRRGRVFEPPLTRELVLHRIGNVERVMGSYIDRLEGRAPLRGLHPKTLRANVARCEATLAGLRVQLSTLP